MLLSQAKLHNNNNNSISNASNMSMKNKGNNNNNNNHCSPAILYLYPCLDGVFAALAAHLYFKATSLLSPLFFPNTVYNPLRFLPHSVSTLCTLPFCFQSLLCFFIHVYILFLSWIAIFSAEDLPLNEIGDLYLLDFVGPDGFVQEISTKVPRCLLSLFLFSYSQDAFFEFFFLFLGSIIIGFSYLCVVLFSWGVG